jgi:membrane protein YqaA with SNARE-associated domain
LLRHDGPVRNEGGIAGIVNWLVVWVLAVALNAVPAFMPPTWSVLAYFHLYHGLPVLPLAFVGALGATTGRAILALGSRAFGNRVVPASWRANVEALVDTLQSRPTLALPSLALFALGPVPSNHLFVAAGLARAPLPPILAVFGTARFVSYVLWVNAANLADRSLREVFGPRLGGWGAVALQLAGFALIVLLMRIDWRRRLRGRLSATPEQSRSLDYQGPGNGHADGPGV